MTFAFISYSRDDRAYVDRLSAYLAGAGIECCRSCSAVSTMKQSRTAPCRDRRLWTDYARSSRYPAGRSVVVGAATALVLAANVLPMV